MGLDSNFYSMPQSYDSGDLSFVGFVSQFDENYNTKWQQDKNVINTSYFRKNHDLHEWIKKLFIRKGGEKDKNKQLLNHTPVKITLEDLNQIKDEFRHEEYVMPDYDYENLKDELEKGRVLYYYASY